MLENQARGTLVARFSELLPDSTIDFGFDFEGVKSTSPRFEDYFLFDPEYNLRVRIPLDFESGETQFDFELEYKGRDSDTGKELSFFQTFSISVANQEVETKPDFIISENQPMDSPVGSIQMYEGLRLSLISEEEFFYIDENGVIRTRRPLDFEKDPTQFTLDVHFQDNGWEEDGAIFVPTDYIESYTVSITDEWPEFSNKSFEVQENEFNDVVIGDISPGGYHTKYLPPGFEPSPWEQNYDLEFEFLDDLVEESMFNRPRFEDYFYIDSRYGDIRTKAPIDFEAFNTVENSNLIPEFKFKLRISVVPNDYDEGWIDGLSPVSISSDISFTIKIKDLNPEFPVKSFKILEGQPADTLVGTILPKFGPDYGLEKPFLVYNFEGDVWSPEQEIERMYFINHLILSQNGEIRTRSELDYDSNIGWDNWLGIDHIPEFRFRVRINEYKSKTDYLESEDPEPVSSYLRDFEVLITKEAGKVSLISAPASSYKGKENEFVGGLLTANIFDLPESESIVDTSYQWFRNGAPIKNRVENVLYDLGLKNVYDKKIYISPDERYCYVFSNSGDSISIHRFIVNSNDGSLVPDDSKLFSTGVLSTELEFSKDGKHLYYATDDEVGWLQRDENTGEFSPSSSLSFASLNLPASLDSHRRTPSEWDEDYVTFGVYDISLTSDGKHLYVSYNASREWDVIRNGVVVCFARDLNTGNLSLVNMDDIGVNEIVLTNDGNYAFANYIDSDGFSIFKRNKDSGTLTSTQHIWLSNYGAVNPHDGPWDPLSISLPKDAPHLYVGIFGETYIFSIDPSSGSLNFLQRYDIPYEYRSPDGRHLYDFSSWDGDMINWYGRNLESGLIDFTEHGFIGGNQAFSFDGPVISDGVGFLNSFSDLAFSSDGKRVYILGNDSLGWLVRDLQTGALSYSDTYSEYDHNESSYVPRSGDAGSDIFVRVTLIDNSGRAQVLDSPIFSVPNNPPEFTNYENSFIVQENQPAGTLVGTITAVDPDLAHLSYGGLRFSHRYPEYPPTGDGSNPDPFGAQNYFQITKGGKIITTRPIDFESDPTSFEMLIGVEDPSNLSVEKSFTIKISDQIEFASKHFEVLEDQPAGTIIGSILREGTASDYEINDVWITDENGEEVDWFWILNDEHFYLWLDAGEIALEIDSKGILRTVFPFDYQNYPNELKLVGTMSKKTDQYWKSFEFSISILEKQWWHDAEQQGDNWYTSDWFGSFMKHDSGWLFHETLHWAYAKSDLSGGLWLWHENYGWLWTKEELWPYLYQHDSSSWLYFITKRNGRPYFYDYSTESLK